MPAAVTFPFHLAAAKRGSERSWSWLYDRFSGNVVAYVLSQRGDVDEVCAETWLQAVRDIGSFSGDASAFTSWLVTIARHRLVDAYRYDQRRPYVPADTAALARHTADWLTPERQVDAALELEEVIAALAELTDEQREVVTLRFFAGLPAVEVAKLVGKEANAVRQLQHRAVSRLRDILDGTP